MCGGWEQQSMSNTAISGSWGISCSICGIVEGKVLRPVMSSTLYHPSHLHLRDKYNTVANLILQTGWLHRVLSHSPKISCLRLGSSTHLRLRCRVSGVQRRSGQLRLNHRSAPRKLSTGQDFRPDTQDGFDHAQHARRSLQGA